MSISERAERAAGAIFAALQLKPTEAQRASVRDVIEQALVNAALEAGEHATQAILECCSPDLDTAHKAAEEIRRQQTALVANLSSLR